MFQTFNFFNSSSWHFSMFLWSSCNSSSWSFWSKTCICSKWLFWGFSSSFIFFGICSNSVEQSRFWCRADFLSRWLLSRWPISIITYPKKLTSNSLHNLSRFTKSLHSGVILIVHQSQIWERWRLISCFLSTVGGYFEAYSSQFSGSTFGPNLRPSQTAWTVEEQIFKSKMWLKQRNQSVLPRPWFLRSKVPLRIYEVLCISFLFV